jgi:hypothetical protein
VRQANYVPYDFRIRMWFVNCVVAVFTENCAVTDKAFAVVVSSDPTDAGTFAPADVMV